VGVKQSTTMRVLRPRYLTIAAADLAGAVTAAIILVPAVKFAYRSGSSHIMLETATAMIAVIAAVLVYGRFRHGGSMSDLLLLVALCFFAAPKFIVPYVAGAISGSPSRFVAWSMLVASIIGAALFTLAAFLPERRLSRPGASAGLVAAAAIAGAVAVAYVLALLSTHLPLGLDPSVSNARYPQFAAPAIIGFELAGLVFFGASAVGFTRRAEWSGDEFTSWLAASAALASFSRLNYILFPSLDSQWVYPADLLRLGAYLLILVGAAREIRRNQRDVARGGILEERRRMARELHDGLAQELSFLVTKSRELVEGVIEPDQRELRRLAGAAERALDESRRAITALSAPLDESLESAIAQTVDLVANRVGVRAETVVDPGINVPPAMREALLRIVREAVTNATRHGGASRVHVEFANGDILRLTVRDNGTGFDPTAATRDSDGFGLTTMAERVHAIGGELRVSSRPAEGTQIEVTIP
jgi:signal transduction histidine kinase